MSNKVGIICEGRQRNVHCHKPVVYLYTPVFPVLCAGLGILAFVSGYVIAVLNDHEEAWFSMISDGGTLPPESCIFGLLLSFSNFFWYLTCFARHCQLIQYVHYHRGPETKFRGVIWFMLITGLASGTGTAIVACFQEGGTPTAHGLGALLSFFAGMIYIWCYVAISVVIRPSFAPKWLTIARIVVTTAVTSALIMHQICMFIEPFVEKLPDGSKPPHPEAMDGGIYRMKPGEPYYLNHLIACISEWILGIGFFVIIGSLCYELNTFELNTLTKEDEKYLFEENRTPVLVSHNLKH
ncbi:unnamed protein product [Bursaphelenchus xylophilus]|uniref:(pine wood nematode) hypothetical protein n=1 Tax=Bursaphelenchus xylophilus TaxID=6326 RepID=A0A1I7RQI2_BURXY|nr:unnamed protein product [Bursaphelenchus xylophilus]CAG9104622.1 unnamed protein product [Bursaphelenchus xylophilus]